MRGEPVSDPSARMGMPPPQGRRGRLRRAEQLIRQHALAGAGAGLVPLPGWDLAGVLGARLSMMRTLARLYEADLHRGRGPLAIGGLVAGTLQLPMAVPWAASLLKTIPGIGTGAGTAAMPLLAGGGTYALGRLLVRHFEAGGRLDDFDLTRQGAAFRREYERSLRVLRRDRRRPTRHQHDDGA